jgi:hypothetical protein
VVVGKRNETTGKRKMKTVTIEQKDGRNLKHYGLRAGQTIHTACGTGKAMGTQKTTSHVNSFEMRKGQIFHGIIVELADGTRVTEGFSVEMCDNPLDCPDSTLEEIFNDARRRTR